MNDKAEQLIIDAGEKVLAYLEATEEFAVEQAPLLAQEIVRWGVWWHGLAAVGLFTIPLISLAFMAWTIWNPGVRSWANGEDNAPYLFHVVTVVVGISLPFGWGLFHFCEVLKAVIAPRLYIIEQIGGLLG